MFAQSPDLDISYEAGHVPKTEVENGPKAFIVGSGETEANPPLEKGVNYKIYLGSCSVINTVCMKYLTALSGLLCNYILGYLLVNTIKGFLNVKISMLFFIITIALTDEQL